MTQRKVPVAGKVAAILDDRELVINRGEADGVTLGMRFVIMPSQGVQVHDPDTKEPLGYVPIEKTIVKVVRVQPRLSVGRTFRTIGGTPGFIASPSFAAAIYGTSPTPELLETTETRLWETMNEEDLKVRVGDEAIEVSGPEYED